MLDNTLFDVVIIDEATQALGELLYYQQFKVAMANE